MAGFGLGITRLDLSSIALTRVFQPVQDSFVGAAVLSPDGQIYFMIYSPPRDPTDPEYGASSLYTLPADGSGEPRQLLQEDDSGTYYLAPWWSPDGRAVYYGRQVNPDRDPTGKYALRYFLTRYTLPDGPAQDLVSDAFYLRTSVDGQKLFYLSGDFYSSLNDIFVAEPDGSNPISLLPRGEDWIVDLLAVAPDGQSIVFSSADRMQVKKKVSWFDTLLGVQVAQAHSVPSDLFMMKIGEAPQQFTHLADAGFVVDYSPDGQYIVFSCTSGVYLIRPDGTGLTMIMSTPVFGSVQWVR